MEEHKRKRGTIIRSNVEQIKFLVDYMSANKLLARGQFTGPFQGAKHLKWGILRQQLAKLGSDKTEEQWQKTWQDLIRKARKEYSAAMAENNKCLPVVSLLNHKILDALGVASTPHPSGIEAWGGIKKRAKREAMNRAQAQLAGPRVPRLSEQASIVLDIIGFVPKPPGECDSESQIESAQKKSGTKKGLNFNYNVVRRRCIDLVKSGFPAAIIDDEAFRGILSLIPMHDEARNGLTSEYIQKLVADNDDNDNDETQMDEDDDDDDPLQGNDDFDDDEQDSSMTGRRRSVKVEFDNAECTCAQKDADAHELDCPMASKLLPFLNYYEQLVTDSAVCTLCRARLAWADVCELKEHLDKAHPNIRYEDHAPPDRPSFLESDSSLMEDTRPGRKPCLVREKKKEPKEPPRIEFFFDEKGVDDVVPPRKRPRMTDVTLVSSEKIPMEQFKLLDRFGLYVAALLETLPKEKCLRYQQQIVEKLLKEQAAAG